MSESSDILGASQQYLVCGTEDCQKQLEQSKEKSGVKQTLTLSSSITKVKTYSVPFTFNVHNVSVNKSGRLWVSDWSGNLVQTDLQGNLLQIIDIRNGGWGYHTVTKDGDLLCTDFINKMIYRITPDKNITTFIKTGDWSPLSIHSSHINGDILVGMMDGMAKVTRYNKTGQEIQNIQMDNKGQELYRNPHYITENINGDICTSDQRKYAVVVVNKSGQHRFSYTGQELCFWPWGICTDVLGHILVCDSVCNTVHLLNQDGGFLSIILSHKQGVDSPRGVYVDDENNLHVGQEYHNKVTVFKYLQ